MEILYIHPHGHIHNDRILPCGAISSMNTIQRKKKGIYSYQLTKELVIKAKVVLIDVHWPFAIETTRIIVEWIKERNPCCAVILAGYTAGLYPEYMLSVTKADYVIYHDSEVVVSDLIDYIFSGGRMPKLPNILRKGRTRSFQEDISQEAFNRLDFIDSSWFHGYWGKGVLRYFQMLTRGCARRMLKGHSDSANRCVSRRTHSSSRVFRYPEKLEQDLCDMKKLHSNDSISYEFFTSQISESLLEEYLDVLNKPWGFNVALFACNSFCERMMHIPSDSAGNKLLKINSYFKCLDYPRHKIATLLSPSQRVGMTEMLKQNKQVDVVNDSRQTKFVLPFAISLSPGKAIETQDQPIGWEVPPARIHLRSSSEETAYLHDLSRVTSKLTPLKYLAPGIYSHYKFNRDINEIPPLYAIGTEHFHKLVCQGIKKWGMQVNEYIQYLVWKVKLSVEKIPDCDIVYAPDFCMITEDEDPKPAVLQINESGWTLCIMPPTKTHDFPSPCDGLVVIPKGMESVIGVRTGTELIFINLSREDYCRIKEIRMNFVNNILEMLFEYDDGKIVKSGYSLICPE